MRPGRGRPSGSKNKTCVVRLEKIMTKEDSDEEDRKKLTGPLKKRPVVMKKSPGPGPGRPRKSVGSVSPKYILATDRARRTPKPNPKYSNDDIVTPKLRLSGKSEGGDESEEEEEEEEENISEVENLTEESSEEEFEPRKAVKVTRSTIGMPQSPPAKRGRGRPPKNRLEIDQQKFKIIDKRKYEYDSEKESSESTLIARNKRLNIELYDASDSDVSIISPGRKIMRAALENEKSLRLSTMKQTIKKFPGKPRGRPRIIRQTSDDDEDLDATTGAASTIDDFETMPTFTIVNINDIINKKGDVLIQKSSPQRIETNTGDDSNSVSPASRNRRKSMHTTILSDKIDHTKLNGPPPRSPFPPRKPITQYSNSFKSITNNNDNFKSAPRILNSVLAKKNKPITSMVTKCASKERPSEPETYGKILQNQAKENYSNNRKLPNEKVVVQRQGNKLIKKITCFETWYVINIPPNDPSPPKLNFEMSLTNLGNNIKDITLPSDIWSYKVTLQKIPQSQLAQSTEVFTGEVQDANIDESEKHNYHPINIMFRRSSQNQKLRMPYDRAVIFKNKTYFTNIEGKNVRLLGAPQCVSNINDIEILLEIVDEMTLVNPYVEQTTYVL